jgi:hypothetical protein
LSTFHPTLCRCSILFQRSCNVFPVSREFVRHCTSARATLSRCLAILRGSSSHSGDDGWRSREVTVRSVALLDEVDSLMHPLCSEVGDCDALPVRCNSHKTHKSSSPNIHTCSLTFPLDQRQIFHFPRYAGRFLCCS